MILNSMVGIRKTRFNRYMVECECGYVVVAYDRYSGFNRYMVECEFYFKLVIFKYRIVLIDTWWNVNGNYLLNRDASSRF